VPPEPQLIHMGWRESSTRLTAVRRLCGQPANAPSGVLDQSKALTSRPSSLLLLNAASAEEEMGATD
jgi:hypothetical protein